MEGTEKGNFFTEKEEGRGEYGESVFTQRAQRTQRAQK